MTQTSNVINIVSGKYGRGLMIQTTKDKGGLNETENKKGVKYRGRGLLL